MNSSNDNDSVARHLERQIRSSPNVRYLRTMPMFAVNDDRPGMFDEMLRKLDQAEARARGDS